jgi:hypothetical protein
LRFTIIPINGKLNKNLQDLRKRVFILRDIDYPEFFNSPLSHVSQQIKMRSDIFAPPLMSNYNRVNPLNFGEYHKNLMVMKRPIIQRQTNNFNRFPIRFPDSHEVSSTKQILHVRQKKNYLLDHRGAAPDFNKPREAEVIKNERNAYYQPSIAVPMLAIPQMSVLHIPYTMLQVPLSMNQRSLSTFNNPQRITHTENIGVNSISVPKFSLPDQTIPDGNKTMRGEHKTEIKYSTKLSENMDSSNDDFRPIISPFQYMRKVRSTVPPQKITTTAITTTEKSIKTQRKNETRKLRQFASSTESTLETTAKNYDIVVTRSSTIESQTTERPVLKWYPKKQRNRPNSPSPLITTTVLPTTMETTSVMRNNISNTNNSSRSLLFRGRNRFMLSNREKNRTTATEKSTALSSKWKVITSTVLPATALTIETTKLISNYPTTTRENESATPQPQNKVEVILANVQEVKSNSSNIDIFKAVEIENDALSTTAESITISLI